MFNVRVLLTVSALWLCQYMSADPITPERAAQLAAQYVADKASKPQLVKAGPRKRTAARLSRKAAESAPYYIYSRGDNCGFVIVSGDDALPEVLGYTTGGNFDENDMPEFLAWYLDYYGQAAEAAQAVGAPRMAPTVMASGRQDIAPLIQTHWHQTEPYFNKCPLRKDGGGRCVTGCVATAASQVLYYWHKDLTDVTLAATSSYVYGDQAQATTAFPKGTKIKWDLMRLQYSSEPAEYKDAVATLMAVVGGGAGLTYGSSTGGHNDDCRRVFSNIFGMNGGTENNKDWGQDYNNYSDEAWSTLLYNELVKQRPVLYSGCNASGEGHAVVVDGYQASTGYFHFNLGWGNPSAYDGYFTVARGKSPSWGFNDSWQECVTGVYPKTQNLDAELKFVSKIYYNRNNTVNIEIRNKGTLDYSGVYVFVNTNGAKPTKLTEARASDTETVLPNSGDLMTLSMDLKPTTTGKNYIIVTDANLNVLAKVEKEILLPESNVVLKDMSIDGCSETETHNGESYTVVYNTKATANVTFADRSGLGFEGSPRMSIYESTDGGQTFNYVGYKSAKMSIDANEEANVAFSIISTSSCPISVGNLYYGVLVNPIPSTKTTDVIDLSQASDTIVRFILKGSDLEAESFVDGVLKLKGTWDVNAFTTLAKKTAYKTATAYDLTDVEKISTLPLLETNPNALYYVNSDAQPSGMNYVKDGVCSNLVLTVGYNFVPVAALKATKATVRLNQVPCKWYLFTAPCTLDVPQGVLARQVNSHTSSGISNKTSEVSQLEAGHTYILMTTSKERQLLNGYDAEVVQAPLPNVDEALVGTFVATATPEGAMLINDADQQYFDPAQTGTAVEPLRGYFYAANVKKSFRAYSQLASDPTFLNLAKSINSAYTAIEQNKSYTTADAQKQLLALVDSAEIIFSDRTNTTEIARNMSNKLTAAIEDFAAGVYNPDAEQDCTSLIVNPSFETGRTNGWTTAGTVQRNDNLTYKSVDADGQYILYTCKSDSTADELSQTITGLKAGKYRLTAMVGSTEGHTITLFANDSTVTVKAHHLGVHYFTKAVIDNVEVDETGELTIGVKAGFFYKVDDFRLFLTEEAEAPRQKEDVNGDGTIDTQDVLNIYEFIGQPVEADKDLYDVNGDGLVDTQDVLKVYEIIQNN